MTSIKLFNLMNDNSTAVMSLAWSSFKSSFGLVIASVTWSSFKFALQCFSLFVLVQVSESMCQQAA